MLRAVLSLLLLLPFVALSADLPSEPAAVQAVEPSAAIQTLAEQARDQRRVTPDAEVPVLLVLGDSLSAAYGLPLDQGWVSLLQRRIAERGLAHRVVNAAISGDTVAGGLSRLPALLAEHQPAILVIELGANDGLRGFPPSKIEDDLVTLVEQAQTKGAQVLLIGVRLPPNYGPAYTERFQRLFATVSERTGVALVPRLLEGVADDLALMQADGLHPTVEAQPLILETVWPVLAPLLDAAQGGQSARGNQSAQGTQSMRRFE
jgi:acyl-CoA thioesterase-1